MGKLMLVWLLCMIASAEVVVKESVSQVTGVKTVVLAVRGDKPYRSTGTSPLLGVRCRQLVRNQKAYSRVELMLETGVVTENGPLSPLNSLSSRLIDTLFRFDEEPRARRLIWTQGEDPSILILDDFKFIRDRLFKSKLVHIQVTGFQSGTAESSFDLTGLQEEYSKHQECKQQ